MGQKILITIPVFNEEAFLIECIQNINRVGYDYIIIDDGSNVKTRSVLDDNNMHYISHTSNLGQGAALRTGRSYAIQNEYDIVVHFDGDGQHDYKEIPKLIEPILSEKVQIVFGSRFLKKASKNNIPLLKRSTLRLARIFEGLRTGLWLTDAHCGFRAISTKSYQQMNLNQNRMAHASEILSETKRLKIKFDEVPVTILYFENDSILNIAQRILNIFYELISRKRS